MTLLAEHPRFLKIHDTDPKTLYNSLNFALFGVRLLIFLFLSSDRIINFKIGGQQYS